MKLKYQLLSSSFSALSLAVCMAPSSAAAAATAAAAKKAK
jgi:hypothetical protein